MPTENHLDAELPNIFIRQALLAPDANWKASSGQGGGWTDVDFASALAGSSTIVGAVGSRVSTQEGSPRNPAYPRILWHGREDESGAVSFYLPRAVEIRKVYIATVRRLDKYDSGSGSFSPARPTYDALCKCLLGAAKSPITGQAGLLGNVVATTRVKDHRTSYIDQDTGALITELGIVVAIAYENN